MSLLYGDNFEGQNDLSGKYLVFSELFKNCVTLRNAKNLVLPATTLDHRCYYAMFYGCISLVVAPELPAAALVYQCYNYMFYNCSSLNYIKAMFIYSPGLLYTYNWMNGVSNEGTFVKNKNASWNVTGNDSIPSGWTVQTA